MALFRRKQTTEIPELQEYYENEKQDRPAVAWALALISLLSTVAIVLLLFFAGRWVYDRIKKDDQPAPTPVVTEQTDQPQGATNTDESANEETTESSNTDQSATPETATPTPATTSTSTTPATGSLPATGPTEPEL